MAKYHRLADQNGFHFVPAGQIHESIKRLITEQIRHKLTLSEGEAKQSKSEVGYEMVDKVYLYGHCYNGQ